MSEDLPPVPASSKDQTTGSLDDLFAGSAAPDPADSADDPENTVANAVGPGPVAPVDPDDGLFDDDLFRPAERGRPARLTVVLVAVLVLAVGALGGIWIQKQLGSSGGGMAAGMPAGGPGGRSGTGGQGLPGGGASGMPGGGPSGMPGGGPSGSNDGGGGGAGSETGADQDGSSGTGVDATPAVVGTVTAVRSASLVVTDLGGTRHRVAVTDTTTVTMPYGHAALKVGDTVAVVGTTSGDTVAATAITLR